MNTRRLVGQVLVLTLIFGSIQSRSLWADPVAEPSPIPSPTPTYTLAPAPSMSPVWKEQTLGHMEFDPCNRGKIYVPKNPSVDPYGPPSPEDHWVFDPACIEEQRKTDADFSTYSLNEEGKIRGTDFLGSIYPPNKDFFVKIMRAQGKADEEIDRLFSLEMQTMVDRAMAMLMLNRVLDHEAMKRKLTPHVLPERVDYVVRAILFKNAIETDRVPVHLEPVVKDRKTREVAVGPGCKPQTTKVPDSELTQLSEEVMYAWLKERVGNGVPTFNIDWKFGDGGLEASRLKLVGTAGEFNWPYVKLSMGKKLPATLAEFKAEIQGKLTKHLHSMNRQIVWGDLVQRKDPHASSRSRYFVTDEEMNKIYNVFKAQAFTQQDLQFSGTGLVVSGERAEEFLKRYNDRLSLEEKSIRAELFPQPTAGAPAAPPADAEENKRLREKIVQYRKTAPQNVLNAVLPYFADDVTQGKLTVSIEKKSFRQWVGGMNAIPADDSVESQFMRAAFGLARRDASAPAAKMMEIFPRASLGASKDCVTRVMLFEDFKVEGSSEMDRQDPRVVEFLKGKILGKFQARLFRDLALHLLTANLFVSETPMCLAPSWPCVSSDPSRWVESLFAEKLYPGETLGTDASGNPIRSTLNHYELNGRVFEISLDALGGVFEIPNSN